VSINDQLDASNITAGTITAEQFLPAPPRPRWSPRRIGALLAVLAILAMVLLLGGCAKFAEPFQDAPRGSTNNTPADTVTFPDGFSNWATKCDHGNRLYSAYHGDSSYAAGTVVPNDPTCKGQQ